MLKIKDNVELKSLQKYGFKYWGDDHYKASYMYDEGFRGCNCAINVYTKDRRLEIVDSYSQEVWDEVLFDLINDGLVEKVENE